MADNRNINNNSPQQPNATFSFNETNTLISNLIKGVSALTGALSDTIKANKSTEKDYKNYVDEVLRKEKEQDEQFKKDYQTYQESVLKREKEQEEQYKRWQEEETKKQKEDAKKLSDSIVSAIRGVINWGVQQWTTSFNAVQNSYNQHFTAITTKMNLTAQAYSDIYRETARQLRETHLDVQFDTTDFTNQLEVEFSQGLRGQTAQTKALSDLIAKKVVPTLNTTSRDYVFAYRKMGEDFAKYSIGLQRMNTSLEKNMEYFESNMYTTTENQFLKWYQGTGASLEGYYQLQQSLADLTTAFGQDFTNNFVSQLNQSIQSGVVTTPMMMLGYGTSGQMAQDLLYGGSGGVLNLVNKYLQTLGSFSNVAGSSPESITVLNALKDSGIITSAIDAKFVSQYRDDLSLLKVTSSELNNQYQDVYRRLTQGQFTSETEKYTHLLNNTDAIVQSSTWITEHIPNQIQQLIGVVGSGLASILGVLTGGSLLNKLGESLASHLTGKVPNLGGKGGLGGLLGGAGGKLLGVGGIAAGLAWSAFDAIQSAQSVGAAGGNALLAGLSKFTLGSDYAQRDLGYKLRNAEFDFSEVLSSAGKGALVGGGAGLLGGPIGGLIGTAVGGLVGAVTNSITQLVNKADFKAYNDAVQNLTKSTSALNTAQIKYDDAIKNSKTLTESLNILQDEANYTDSQRNQILKALQSKYPEVLKNISDINELTDSHIQYLEAQNQQELLNAQFEYDTAKWGHLNALDEYTSKAVIQGAFSSEAVEDILGHFKGNTISNASIKALAAKYGYKSPYEFATAFNKATGSLLTGWSNDTDFYLSGFSSNQEIIDRVKTLNAQYKQGDQATFKSTYQDLISLFNDLALNENVRDWQTPETLQEVLDSYAESARLLNYAIRRSYPGYPELHSDSSILPINDIKERISAKGWNVSIPEFAIGLPMVPYDNYLARLHRGEMVLTASDANMYRQLIGLTALQATSHVSQVETVPTQLMTNINSTIMVISTDIKTIIELLNGIQSGIKNRLGQSFQQTVDYPSEILNYESSIY